MSCFMIGVLSLIKKHSLFVKAIYTKSDFIGLYPGLNLRIFDHKLYVVHSFNK